MKFRYFGERLAELQCLITVSEWCGKIKTNAMISPPNDKPSDTELKKTLQALRQELKASKIGLAKSITHLDILQTSNQQYRDNLLEKNRDNSSNRNSSNSSNSSNSHNNVTAALLASANLNDAERYATLASAQHTCHLLKEKFEKKTKLRTSVTPFNLTSVLQHDKKRRKQRPTPMNSNAGLCRLLSEKSTVELIELWSTLPLNPDIVRAFQLDDVEERCEETDRQQALETLCRSLITRATTTTTNMTNGVGATTTTEAAKSVNVEVNQDAFHSLLHHGAAIQLVSGETLAGCNVEWLQRLKGDGPNGYAFQAAAATAAAADGGGGGDINMRESDLILESAEGRTTGETEHSMIKSATLLGLVRRLTHPHLPDMNVRFVFLLTYRNFISPHGLLTLLIHRFFVPNLGVGEEGGHAMRGHFLNMIMAPIQIKVLRLMKAWLDDFFDDFSVVVEELSNMSAAAVDDGDSTGMVQGGEEAGKEEAGKEEAGKGETRKEIAKNAAIKLQTQNGVVPPASMYQALEQFLLYIQIYSNSCSGNWTFSIAENLLKSLRKKKSTMERIRDEDSDPRVESRRVESRRVESRVEEASKQVTINTSMLVTSMLPPPPSIVPPGGLHPAMFDQLMLTTRCHGETINVACLLSPIEVARQCTLVDHQLFCQIKMVECLSKKRTKSVLEFCFFFLVLCF